MALNPSSQREAQIVDSATRNGTKQPTQQEERRPSPSRRPGSEAEREQERLWADCIARNPEILSEIATLVETARTRLVESPPVAPSDDDKPERH